MIARDRERGLAPLALASDFAAKETGDSLSQRVEPRDENEPIFGE
jgi:hypothetical protein